MCGYYQLIDISLRGIVDWASNVYINNNVFNNKIDENWIGGTVESAMSVISWKRGIVMNNKILIFFLKILTYSIFLGTALLFVAGL